MLFDGKKLLSNAKYLTNYQKLIIALSLLTLVLSMFFPAFYIDRKDYDAYANGPYLFFLGWTGLVIGDFECLFWLANPLFITALILFINKKKLSILVSLTAVVIAFLFSRMTTIVSDESGAISKITSFELGYKLWLTSFAILFVGIIIDLTNLPYRKRR